MCVCETESEQERGTLPHLFSLTVSSSLLQRHNGEILTTASVKHLSHRRFVVLFQLDNVQRSAQDLYRCVTQSPRGSGVSNFAELIVKGKHLHSFVPCSLSVHLLFLSPQPSVVLMIYQLSDFLFFSVTSDLQCKSIKCWKLYWSQPLVWTCQHVVWCLT